VNEDIWAVGRNETLGPSDAGTRAALEQFVMRGGVQSEIGVQVYCKLDAGPTWKYRLQFNKQTQLEAFI